MPSIRATFDKNTTGTQVAEAFRDQIRGKHVLITGVSPNSLGEAAALAMARAGPALLILASRTPSNLGAVASRVVEEAAGGPGVVVRTVVLDLASLASVRAAAGEVTRLTGRLDVLINNAGINASERRLSPDGVELTFATNHVGPFLLTSLLLPLLLRAAAAAQQGKPGQARIVNVSSDAHRVSPMRFGDFNFEGRPVPDEERPPKGLPSWITTLEGGYNPTLAYGMSKCANVLFTVALQERLRSRGIESYSLHPGTIRTELVRDIQPEFKDYLEQSNRESWKTCDQGSATILVAAWDPSLPGSDCIFLSDCQIARPSRHASDKATAERLWDLTETLVAPSGQASRL